mgnify:FL=1
MLQKQSERYQIRQAAGMYWLLDMEQSGIPYRQPVLLNETGAAFWKLLAQGKPEDEVASVIASEYGVSREEIRQDVEQFLQKLRSQGVTI